MDTNNNINPDNVDYETFKLTVGMAMAIKYEFTDQEREDINKELSQLWEQETGTTTDSQRETLFVL